MYTSDTAKPESAEGLSTAQCPVSTISAGADARDEPAGLVADIEPGGGLTGRLSAWASLKDDPLWPTRRPIRAASRILSGVGRPVPLPPGPKGLPVIGSVRELRRDPYEYFRRAARTYGDIYRVPMPLFDLVMVQHPDYIKQVLDEPTGQFSMIGPFLPVFARAGAAIPMLEGDKFRQRRRMLMPMFGRRHLARVAETLAEEFTLRMDRWSAWVDTGKTIDLQHEISQVTLPAFLRAMFSSSITEREIHETDTDLRAFLGVMGASSLLMPMPKLVAFGGRDSTMRSIRRVKSLTRRLVEQRRANPTENPDLLNLLLEARYDDGSPLSERDLVMELLILMAGGYETVVASLSWTLAHLLSHPNYLEPLYQEVSALGGATPTPDDLSRLTWAKACFDEGQRLQGAPLNPRFAMADCEIGGYPIPKHTLLGVSMYAIHRDPRWWTNPDVYDPTRFTNESLVKSRPRLAFMPFGSGPHHCVGTGMAYMNAQFLLTILFQRYRLALPSGWRPRHQYAFSTIVRGGLPVTFSRA